MNLANTICEPPQTFAQDSLMNKPLFGLADGFAYSLRFLEKQVF